MKSLFLRRCSPIRGFVTRLIHVSAVYAIFGAGLFITASAQGLVERPFAISPNISCPNGCNYVLSVLNTTNNPFVADELAIFIEPPLNKNEVIYLPQKLKDNTPDVGVTEIVCTVQLDLQLREKIKVDPGEIATVGIEVPAEHLVHSRILGVIGRLKEMPLLCWNVVDSETGNKLSSDCVDLRQTKTVVPLAEDSLTPDPIPDPLCDEYAGDCTCP